MRRRANDAQVERLLDGLQDREYRQKLARKIAERDNIKYDSAMRRLQRYITTAGERRSFVSTPVEYRRSTVQAARRVPMPPPVPVEERSERLREYLTPREREREIDPDLDDDDDGEPDEGDIGGFGESLAPQFRQVPEYPMTDSERETARSRFAQSAESERDLTEYVYNDLLRAIVAYHDGEPDEAGDQMGLNVRASELLDLATAGDGADITGMRGEGELREAVIELLDSLPIQDINDIQDFHDLLQNLPPWEIGMILDDMRSGETTFGDWLDAWHNDDMEYLDVTNSEFWALWRAAYARAKG